MENTRCSAKVRLWEGKLPGYRFMPSLKICWIYQQLLENYITSRFNHLGQNIYQDTLPIGTHYAKRWKGFVGNF